ncbi:hypothetical protein C8J57DRAFT_1516749 [Mycena rebaudengoi]|nr:hypothetical protein C8J57DRAFT_1516749 [Mycena rebaudengoi]
MDMVRARRDTGPGMSSLESFEVRGLSVRGRWKPSDTLLAALSALADDGLNLRIEVVGRVSSETTTVVESGQNGLLVRSNHQYTP